MPRVITSQNPHRRRPRRERYIPVIFAGLFEALNGLLWKFWNDHHGQLGRPSGTQAALPDNGYSCAGILIIGAILESMWQRAKVLRRLPARQTKRHMHMTAEVEGMFPKGVARLGAHIQEVSIVRDVVSHNHMYGVFVGRNRDDWLKIMRIHKYPSAGDRRRFRTRVNVQNRQTKTLRLNVFPTRISSADLVICLEVMLEFMEALSRRIENFGDFSNIGSVPVKGSYMGLDEAIKKWISLQPKLYRP